MKTPDVIYLEADFNNRTGANYITTPITWEALEPDYVTEAGLLSYIRADPAVILAAALEGQTVENLAFVLWKAEADRAAPNVGKTRTPEGFAEQTADTRERWLFLARAALTTKGEAKS
jgi:hypothetical protein